MSSKALIIFPVINIRLYDKNFESDYFFFLHQNQNMFFSNIGNQNIFYFLRKKNHNTLPPPPPPPPPFKLNGPSLNVVYVWKYIQFNLQNWISNTSLVYSRPLITMYLDFTLAMILIKMQIGFMLSSTSYKRCTPHYLLMIPTIFSYYINKAKVPIHKGWLWKNNLIDFLLKHAEETTLIFQ